MTFSLTTRLIAEFLGTAIMVMIGNGSVANVELKGTKGSHSGWVIIAIGYGMAVMIPAREFDSCLHFFTNQIAQNVDYINAFEFFYCQICEIICRNM